MVYHRRSTRLAGYDYAQAGAYFVTICIQDRRCILGDVVDGDVLMNNAGMMVQTVWNELPVRYQGVDIESFVVMPNHVHGIVVLNSVGVPTRRDACPPPREPKGQPRGVAPTLGLPDVVHRFKSLTTTRYRHAVLRLRWPPFRERLWQRNYYEHVIRDDLSLDRIRQYIADNPAGWASDPENPVANPTSGDRPGGAT